MVLPPDRGSRVLPMDLSTALRSFAFLAASPARARAEREPFSAIMGGKHVDDEGRTIVHTTDAGRGEPSEDWYLRMISQAESYRRADVVASSIDPVRFLITQSIAIERAEFPPDRRMSPLVPRLQAPLYALGFARFFQGDFASAASTVTSSQRLALTRGGSLALAAAAAASPVTWTRSRLHRPYGGRRGRYLDVWRGPLVQ